MAHRIRRPMLLRRLGTIAPLAVLVAVLVHLALFGTEHAPGEHAARLYSDLAAALALVALASVLYAALRARRHARRERRSVSQRALFPLELAAGGTLAFGLIELAEGHTPLAGGAWQLAALPSGQGWGAIVSRRRIPHRPRCPPRRD